MGWTTRYFQTKPYTEILNYPSILSGGVWGVLEFTFICPNLLSGISPSEVSEDVKYMVVVTRRRLGCCSLLLNMCGTKTIKKNAYIHGDFFITWSYKEHPHSEVPNIWFQPLHPPFLGGLEHIRKGFCPDMAETADTDRTSEEFHQPSVDSFSVNIVESRLHMFFFGYSWSFLYSLQASPRLSFRTFALGSLDYLTTFTNHLTSLRALGYVPYSHGNLTCRDGIFPFSAISTQLCSVTLQDVSAMFGQR